MRLNAKIEQCKVCKRKLASQMADNSAVFFGKFINFLRLVPSTSATCDANLHWFHYILLNFFLLLELTPRVVARTHVQQEVNIDLVNYGQQNDAQWRNTDLTFTVMNNLIAMINHCK